MTKSETIKVWKEKIGSNYKWAVRALLRIYEEQTADEIIVEEARHRNSVGFTAFDAKLLTSFAEQVQQNRSLSQNQRRYLFKKMPKYAGQLFRLTEGS